MFGFSNFSNSYNFTHFESGLHAPLPTALFGPHGSMTGSTHNYVPPQFVSFNPQSASSFSGPLEIDICGTRDHRCLDQYSGPVVAAQTPIIVSQATRDAQYEREIRDLNAQLASALHQERVDRLTSNFQHSTLGLHGVDVALQQSQRQFDAFQASENLVEQWNSYREDLSARSSELTDKIAQIKKETGDGGDIESLEASYRILQESVLSFKEEVVHTTQGFEDQLASERAEVAHLHQTVEHAVFELNNIDSVICRTQRKFDSGPASELLKMQWVAQSEDIQARSVWIDALFRKQLQRIYDGWPLAEQNAQIYFLQKGMAVFEQDVRNATLQIEAQLACERHQMARLQKVFSDDLCRLDDVSLSVHSAQSKFDAYRASEPLAMQWTLQREDIEARKRMMTAQLVCLTENTEAGWRLDRQESLGDVLRKGLDFFAKDVVRTSQFFLKPNCHANT